MSATDIAALLRIASRSPSAHNTQPWAPMAMLQGRRALLQCVIDWVQLFRPGQDRANR